MVELAKWGRKMTGESLNLSVRSLNRHSSSESSVIVGSAGEGRSTLPNFGSVRHLQQHAASTDRNSSVELASKFGLEEVTPTKTSGIVPEFVHSDEKSRDIDKNSIHEPEPPKRGEEAAQAPGETSSARLHIGAGLLGFSLAGFIATMVVAFAGLSFEIHNWYPLMGGLGGASLLAYFGSLILLRIWEKAEAAMHEVPPVVREGYDFSQTFNLGLGTFGALITGAFIGTAVYLTGLGASWSAWIVGAGAVVMALSATVPFWRYFAERDTLRAPTENNPN